MAERKNSSATKIKKWRKLLKLDEKKASLVCCVSENVYHKFETGELIPDPTTLNRICIFGDIGKSSFEENVSLDVFEEKMKSKMNKSDYDIFSKFRTSPDKLGEKLKSIRETHNLTQKQMAQIAYCQAPSYTKAENGKCLLNQASIICISNFFDVEVSKLIDDTLHPFIFSAEYRGRFDYPNRRRKED